MRPSVATNQGLFGRVAWTEKHLVRCWWRSHGPGIRGSHPPTRRTAHWNRTNSRKNHAGKRDPQDPLATSSERLDTPGLPVQTQDHAARLTVRRGLVSERPHLVPHAEKAQSEPSKFVAIPARKPSVFNRLLWGRSATTCLSAFDGPVSGLHREGPDRLLQEA